MRISRRYLQALFSSMFWWLGVAASFILFLLFSRSAEEKSLAQFEYRVENAQLAIQTRVRSYIDVLRGAAALFSTVDQVSRRQFHDYISQLKLERSFPGITNINFAPYVKERDKETFELQVRRDTSLNPEGYPGFAIKPPGQRTGYHVLTYLEPLDTNLVSFGFDISSNENGARALEVSRDSGQLFSSGKLIRISGPNQHVGLAMRMPLYRRGMPIETVEQRRAAYFGSVGAGFDVEKLMRGAVDKTTLSHMRIRVYDVGGFEKRNGTNASTAENLLFDSAMQPDGSPITGNESIDGAFLKRTTMTVGPRVWEMEFTAHKSAMTTGIDDYLPFIVLFGGLSASIMLFSISYSLATARRRAVEIATDMTKDLRTSETSLAEAQHMARLGSWVLEPTGGAMTWSAETYRIFGMDRFADPPRYEDFLKRIHESDRQRVREGLERSMSGGDEFNTEHRIIQRDGSVRWVQTISRPGNDDNTRLLRGTIMDITDRKHTMEALKRSQELLRELTAHQDRVKEAERKRIAREIHDELGQTLLALRIDVSMLDARTAKSHPRLNEKVRGALHQIDATVKTIRTIINNLRPAVLDLGLTAAIEWQVSEFRRRSGIACDLFMGEKEFVVDDARATSLFRILQESLTNVIRHANASHVVIELYQEDNRLVMKITDNGVGIYPDSRKNANSFGLVGVEERIHALGGEFQISSAPGKGTTLTVYIPLDISDWDEQSFTLLEGSQ
ncbi:MAG TPA: CHASE domain-containing protein [Noviherbaspirillum sp.]